MTTASLLHHLVQAISILPRRGRRVSQTFIYQFWQLASEFDRNEQSTYDNSFNLSFLLPSEDFGNVSLAFVSVIKRKPPIRLILTGPLIRVSGT
jgi:hypothetical protein